MSSSSKKKGGKKAAPAKGKKRASSAKGNREDAGEEQEDKEVGSEGTGNNTAKSEGRGNKTGKDGEQRVQTDASRITNRGVIPHLVVEDAEKALEWYGKAFDGKVKRREHFKDGRILHSELQVFGSTLYVVDDFPQWHEGQAHTPPAHGGTPVTLQFNVDDVDAVVARAVKAGAKIKMQVADQFWGDRYGHLVDPFGHSWAFATPLAGGPADWPPSKFEPPTENPPKKTRAASPAKKPKKKTAKK
jgi:PhnB protein